MKTYLRAMVLAAAFVFFVFVCVMALPWLINEGGTLGMFGIPFVAVTAAALLVLAVKLAFNPEKLQK
ncbi:membrane protein [Burkholderia phage BcepF1]|uniref:Membrane protein n=1 Tax=Burkholderia phage BcepF1 TaxID=2886897 RepID=A1YZQ5_9CAUD|nr:membrane protein [Burkholderia phage BcepF1]ABL96732.1 membrane protein [Burkholderia phage BcepF1]